VKEYESVKTVDENGWRHSRILLKPRSTDPYYSDIIVPDSAYEQFRVIGEFVRVMEFKN
jgi:hypothetical protein